MCIRDRYFDYLIFWIEILYLLQFNRKILYLLHVLYIFVASDTPLLNSFVIHVSYKTLTNVKLQNAPCANSYYTAMTELLSLHEVRMDKDLSRVEGKTLDSGEEAITEQFV